jgi:hypothetical protein
VGLALLVIPAVGVLAGGAFVAITASRRRITDEPAD